MRPYCALVPALLFATSAQAAKYQVDFIAGPEQRSRLNQGTETIDSVNPPTVVRVVEPDGWSKTRASVVVIAYNGSEEPFNFGPENVKIVLPDGTRVGMAPFERLVDEERGRKRGRAFALMLGAIGRGMQASDAGQYNGTVYSNSGRPIATFSGTDNGARAQAQAYANAETRANAEALRQRNAEGTAALGDVLQTTTIDPRKLWGGRVLFALPKSWRRNGTYPVTFEVTAGGMVHSFRANLTRR